VAYLLYKLVFHFIIPIYRTTRQVKKSFREMNERMHQNMNSQTGFQEPSVQEQKSEKKGDYIDFEEVKD
jgi:hypothetical protein